MKPREDPWLNDTTGALRQRRRQAGTLVEKEQFACVSGYFGISMASLAQYQRAVKEAKSTYLSNIISSNAIVGGWCTVQLTTITIN